MKHIVITSIEKQQLVLRLEYYNAISYTVIQEDDVNIDINIHVSETIDIEDDNETGNCEYALIRVIFTRIANDEKNMLFYFRLVL